MFTPATNMKFPLRARPRVLCCEYNCQLEIRWRVLFRRKCKATSVLKVMEEELGAQRDNRGGGGGADVVRKQFPEQVVTRCWELESAGRAAPLGKGVGELSVQGRREAHGKVLGHRGFRERQEPQLDDQ